MLYYCSAYYFRSNLRMPILQPSDRNGDERVSVLLSGFYDDEPVDFITELELYVNRVVQDFTTCISMAL
ncbi:hypothetical protein ACRRTK_018971 [Alexandromys fortis]